MKPVSSLRELLKNMEPELHGEKYVICALPPEVFAPKGSPIMAFPEDEGVTLIMREEEAKKDKKLKRSRPHAMITLRVLSDLEAVGFLAKITSALAEKRISVNVVSAFYHNHLFVPWEKRKEAMEVLKALASGKA
jgi:hypothetical protein